MNDLKNNNKTLSVSINHPEASTVFNIVCTKEQEAFLHFLSEISKNVSMARYEPTIEVSEEIKSCQSDDLRDVTDKVFIFDATFL